MSAAVIERHASAIWERIIQPEAGDLTPDEARAVLRWKFSDADRDRVDELSAKARAGSLSQMEERELDDYLAIESSLTFLKSKARLSLRRAGLTH